MPAVHDDYVLGTHDAELLRLGLQHRVWREQMLTAWRRAGIRPGMRVLDVGAGPGYATMDLAELVGPAGEVLAVERSERFVEFLEATAARRGLSQVQSLTADLMTVEALPSHDLAWCRWVASFAASVPTLVRWIHRSLRPGGVAVFHEYADYGSWRFAPARPHLDEFVAQVMASWRAAGGEPDIAPALVEALTAVGFRIRSARPLIFAARPGEPAWQWPAAFVQTNAERLRGLGRVSQEWVAAVGEELRAAESDPASLMLTPLVLELIAERD